MSHSPDSKICLSTKSITSWYENLSHTQRYLLGFILLVILVMIISRYGNYVVNFFCSRSGVLPTVHSGFKHADQFIGATLDSVTSTI